MTAGGGVLVTTDAALILIEAVVQDNVVAGGHGAGLAASASVVDGGWSTRIDGNRAYGCGGGIALLNNASVMHLAVSGNTASGVAGPGADVGGGGVCAVAVNATVIDLVVVDNAAALAGGGGLLVRQNASLRAIRTIVSSNTAPGGGGAHIMEGGELHGWTHDTLAPFRRNRAGLTGPCCQTTWRAARWIGTTRPTGLEADSCAQGTGVRPCVGPWCTRFNLGIPDHGKRTHCGRPCSNRLRGADPRAHCRCGPRWWHHGAACGQAQSPPCRQAPRGARVAASCQRDAGLGCCRAARGPRRASQVCITTSARPRRQ